MAGKAQASRNDTPCHCTALRKASRRVTQMYDQVLAPSGLKTTQRAVLAQLRRSGVLSVGALAEALAKDANGFAHALSPLAREGWIEIQPDPKDRRGRLVRLTASGARKLRQTDALWDAAQSRFEAVMGRTQAADLRATLTALATS